MKKLKTPKDFDANKVKSLYIICFSVFEGYWNNNPLPNIKTLNNKKRKSQLKKMFAKIESNDELHKKFCIFCDTANIPIPFE